jgi:hypothetical protein
MSASGEESREEEKGQRDNERSGNASATACHSPWFYLSSVTAELTTTSSSLRKKKRDRPTELVVLLRAQAAGPQFSKHGRRGLESVHDEVGVLSSHLKVSGSD